MHSLERTSLATLSGAPRKKLGHRVGFARTCSVLLLCLSGATMAVPVLDYEAPEDERGAPPPIRTFDSDADAAKYVQRKWRGRKIRKLLKMFPSLEQLKEMYLDPKARAAGAADSKWYTAQALKAREHVRLSADIEENCNHAWQCVIEASRHWVAVTAAGVAVAEGPWVATKVASEVAELEVVLVVAPAAGSAEALVKEAAAAG